MTTFGIKNRPSERARTFTGKFCKSSTTANAKAKAVAAVPHSSASKKVGKCLLLIWSPQFSAHSNICANKVREQASIKAVNIDFLISVKF